MNAPKWQIITNPARIWQAVKTERRARKWGNPLHVWKKYRALKERLDRLWTVVTDDVASQVDKNTAKVAALEDRIIQLERIIEERTGD